jgi:glycosyltransferase involved in cell wall biosynthesis
VTFYVGKPLLSKLPEPIEDFETVEIPTPHLRDWAYAAPRGVGGALSHIDAEVFCRRVAKELQKREHDLVQISGRPHFARYVNRIDAPVSIVMHGEPYSLWYDVVKPWGSTYELLEAFDQVITVGGARKAIEERVSRPVTTVNPGVNTGVFTPGDGDREKDKRVLFVGRFVPVKNIELLIEAFSRVTDSHPEAELVLVGDGPRRDTLRIEVEQQGLSDQVRFTGYIPNDELPDIYRNASIFVLPSKSEGYPITLLEAMSCGTPVVAPSVGAIPDIVDDGENGLLYPVGSVNDLADALDTLLSDRELQWLYNKNARKKAVDMFDWIERQRQTYKLYKNTTESYQGCMTDSKN